MSDNAAWTNQVKNYLSQPPMAEAKSERAHEEANRADILLAATKVTSSVTLEHTEAAMLASRVNTAVLVAPIKTRPVPSELLRPQWSVAALPYKVIDPAPVENNPIRVGDFLLWPDLDRGSPELLLRRDEGDGDFPLRRPIDLIPRPLPRPIPLRQAFFALAVPHLLDFSLTVQVTVQPDKSVKIAGGTAVLSLGVYAQEDLQVIEHNRQAWADALAQAGYGNRIWKFVPQNLRNLEATLELPAEHKASEPEISINTNAGVVTLLVQLSETGVLVWKDALEQNNAAAIPGICHLTASYYGRSQNQVNVQQQQLDVALGTLLVNRGREDVHVINPQQTVESTLIVVGNDLIENVTVTLQPNVGQAPETQVFGQDGGQVKVAVTTQNVEGVEVNWTAQVTYKSVGWPFIPISGKMSSSNGWAQIIKPDSWIANYTLMAILVDKDGKPVSISSAGTNYHVNGVLTFTAPYIPVTNILVSSFDASNQLPVNVALPLFPDQPFGDLVLNMFATRDGLAGTKTRKISSTELSIVVLIHPDAQIEIKTARDALPELSTEAEMLGLLALLK